VLWDKAGAVGKEEQSCLGKGCYFTSLKGLTIGNIDLKKGKRQ
jgi:hypothetical protein